MSLRTLISSADLLEAHDIAAALRVVPESALAIQLDTLKTTLSDYVHRMLSKPTDPSTPPTCRTYFTFAQSQNHSEITKILQLGKKHLIDRNAVSILPSLEPLEKALALPKTSRILLFGGRFIDDVPYSDGSLIDNLKDDLEVDEMPLIRDPFSSPIVESILVSYKNHVLQLDEAIPGDPSLARVLSSNLTLSDHIKDQIASAQSKGKRSTEGRNAALAIFLAVILQIDYLGDDAIAEVPCIKKFLYDYAELSDIDLICLHREIKDFPTGLAHRVNIHVHVEMIKRQKADIAFDTKLQAIDASLPKGKKFYATSFAPLAEGHESSTSRYCAELLTGPQQDYECYREYERLLKSKLRNQLPPFVLEFLFDRCIKASSFPMYLLILEVSKNVKDAIYLDLLESDPSLTILSRLFDLICYHGKVAIAEKVLTKHPRLHTEILSSAFVYGCRGGHISILELFRSRLPSFLGGRYGIGAALVASAESMHEAVIDFLMQTVFLSTCPATGRNSVAIAAYAAASKNNYSIFEKLMTCPQFAQIPCEGVTEGNLLGILNVLANKSQLSLVCKIMNMDTFKNSLPEHIRFLLSGYCGTSLGAFLFGCGQNWAPLVQDIIASSEFTAIPATGNFGVGVGLTLASEKGHTSIVKSIIASTKFAEIPALGTNSISGAFYCAATEGHLPIVNTFLESTRADEIPLDGEYSFLSAWRSAVDRGHPPIFLKLVSHPRYLERLTAEQRTLLGQEHGAIQLALWTAIRKNSVLFLQAIIDSEEFNQIPIKGPLSISAAIDSAIASCDFPIACAILSSRRAGELLHQKILAIWDQGLASVKAHPLAIGLLQGPGKLHIPKDGERGLIATYKRAIEEGHLSLFLALQANSFIKSSFLHEECSLLRQENGDIRRALLMCAEEGHLALTIAILTDTESFARIPASGNHSFAEAFEWALQNNRILIVQAFLHSTRSAEIPLSRRKYAVALLESESSAPTNSVSRFFWNLFASRPVDPDPFVLRGFRADDRSYSPDEIDYD